MRTARDRSPSTPRLSRRLVAAALVFCGVAGADAQMRTIAVGDAAMYAISWQPSAGAGMPPIMAISGNWPTACTPTFDSASLSGADLRVDARAVLSLCSHAPTAYAIELDPAAALGLQVLPAGVYHVSYYAANGVQGVPSLRAFALIDTAVHSAAGVVPESGFWWTTSGERASAGRDVFSIEVQGSQLTAALMSYDHDGRGNWQVGSGILEGRVAHVPMLQLAGGSDPFSQAAASPRGEAGLMLDLEFHSNSLAAAWLSRASTGDDGELEVQMLTLARLPFAGAADGSAWTGDWILTIDGEGTAPVRLHLVRLSALAGQGFRLSDADGRNALECSGDAQQPGLPPQQCVLRNADGAQVGRFDAVAMTRMDGSTSSRAGLHLLRVSR